MPINKICTKCGTGYNTKDKFCGSCSGERGLVAGVVPFLFCGTGYNTKDKFCGSCSEERGLTATGLVAEVEPCATETKDGSSFASTSTQHRPGADGKAGRHVTTPSVTSPSGGGEVVCAYRIPGCPCTGWPGDPLCIANRANWEGGIDMIS